MLYPPDYKIVPAGIQDAGKLLSRGGAGYLRVDFKQRYKSELSFPDFLAQALVGQKAPQRIIYGRPYPILDAIPTPDFTAFYQQLE